MRSPFEPGANSSWMVASCLGAALLAAAPANAQEAAAPVSAPAPMPMGEPTPAPAPAEPVAAPAPAPAPAPVMAAPAAAPEVPLKKNPAAINTNFGLRVAGRIQGSTDATKINDASLDTIYLEARFGGTLNKYFGWQANFNGSGKPAANSGTANVMDLILKFDAADEFRVWAGRLLVPSDRSNFSGPFFMSPWNYPGVYGANFIGPKTGANGRDDGVVLWGNILEGKAKYFLGAFNMDNAVQSPLYSGRINIAILGTEPGFWGSSTYYGEKDIVAIGGAFQYQKKGSGIVDPLTLVGTENLTNVMADILVEKNLPGAGTFSLESTYYHFDKAQTAKQAYYVLASFLTADYVGVGKLQPLVRWQQASPQSGGSKISVLDAFVTYVIHNYDLKLAVGYQRTAVGSTAVANAIQIGLQMQD